MTNEDNKKLRTVYAVVNNETFLENLKESFGQSPVFDFKGGMTERACCTDEILKIKPEVIVTEAYMPFMDIYAFIKNISEYEYKPKIYALTGSDNMESIDSMLKNGIRHCILMPTSSLNVVDSVETDLMMEANILEKKIVEIFKELGLSIRSSGYKYLKFMIMEGYRDQKILNCVSKGIYQEIADMYSTSIASVERSMRMVIENAWECRIEGIWEKYFQNPGYKPTVKEFVAEMIYKLR